MKHTSKIEEQPAERIDTAELARAVSRSTRSIERWREQGLIPFYRLNSRTYLYDLREVLQSLERFAVKPKFNPKGD